MQLFYHPKISEGDEQVVFPRDESKHISKVLRKKEGDLLQITNGRGFLFTTKILDANHNKCIAKIEQYEQQQPVSYKLHLAVAPTKMNDRYEWFLEKATEIGIQEITPLICDHSERKTIKPGRYERVLQSAMKQSLHTFLPVLNPVSTFSEFIQQEQKGQQFIAHCEAGEKRFPLKNQIKRHGEITILIGPEGDFSEEEIKLAIENNWQPVSLGNSRLRTETAAIVACHTLSLAHEGEEETRAD